MICRCLHVEFRLPSLDSHCTIDHWAVQIQTMTTIQIIWQLPAKRKCCAGSSFSLCKFGCRFLLTSLGGPERDCDDRTIMNHLVSNPPDPKIWSRHQITISSLKVVTWSLILSGVAKQIFFRCHPDTAQLPSRLAMAGYDVGDGRAQGFDLEAGRSNCCLLGAFWAAHWVGDSQHRSRIAWFDDDDDNDEDDDDDEDDEDDGFLWIVVTMMTFLRDADLGSLWRHWHENLWDPKNSLQVACLTCEGFSLRVHPAMLGLEVTRRANLVAWS